MKKMWMFLVALLLVAASVQAQTFTVTVGWDADATNSTTSYTVSLDGGTPVNIGLPAVVSCTPLAGGAPAPCVPTTLSVPAAGTHTVTVIGYGNWGPSQPGTFTFTIGVPPMPANGRVIKPLTGQP